MNPMPQLEPMLKQLRLSGILDSLVKLKQRIALDSRNAHHGATTGAGVGIVHTESPGPQKAN